MSWRKTKYVLIFQHSNLLKNFVDKTERTQKHDGIEVRQTERNNVKLKDSY